MFFVLSIFRNSSFPKTYVGLASEVVLPFSFDKMLSAGELFYTDTNKAFKLSDLYLFTLAVGS